MVNTLPSPKEMKQHVLAALARYWSAGGDHVSKLPVVSASDPSIRLPLELVTIELPHWAIQCGVEGNILVPTEAAVSGSTWEKVDWWLAMFLLLECWHERAFEQQRGKPIHSYSSRLRDWDSRVWDFAWVNRIALFLRAWTAHVHQCQKEEDLLGNLPKTKIHMTHDVDAIKKTIPIRLKQSLFNLYNGIRNLSVFNFVGFMRNARASIIFLVGKDDWWTFDYILEKESELGIPATFHFYCDKRKKTPISWLMDPSYNSSSDSLKQLFVEIQNNGCSIGLHQSYSTWKQEDSMRNQLLQLETDSSTTITKCRQHWLRFSWKSTWTAQEGAGIKLDSTLMFNNRPGFRASSALAWTPWNTHTNKPHRIISLPPVLMDSHFYDYGKQVKRDVKTELNHWVDECIAVRGEIAVLWHPHTLAKDYDWKNGFEMLLDAIQKARKC